MSKDRETILVIGIGIIIGENYKKLKGIRECDSDHNATGQVRVFSKLKGVYPGNIYEATVSRDESGEIDAIFGDLKFVSQNSDIKMADSLYVTSQAAEIEIAAHNKEKRDNNNRNFLKRLEPLHREYMTLNSIAKSAFELRVLQYLRTGK